MTRLRLEEGADRHEGQERLRMLRAGGPRDTIRSKDFFSEGYNNTERIPAFQNQGKSSL